MDMSKHGKRKTPEYDGMRLRPSTAFRPIFRSRCPLLYDSSNFSSTQRFTILPPRSTYDHDN